MHHRWRFTVYFAVIAFIGLAATAHAAASERFILDMVHDNPGEPPFTTTWTDPAFLRRTGYNGMVPRWFVQCAIAYDAYDPALLPPGSPARTWIDAEAAKIDRDLAVANAAGLPVYPFTDFLVLPKALLEKYGADLRGADGKLDITRPATQAVVRAQVAAIFDRFPTLAGLTLRFGETYLHDTPYHAGGRPMPADGEAAIRGHIALVNLLREEICVKRDRMLFYRTWDFGQFHDRPEFYRAVTDAVEPHPRLVFSVKHQLGDFHRLSIFNPTLGIGRHRQLVEVQAQMEAYGKGSYPYYVGQGVIDGWEEFASTMAGTPPNRPRGLRDFIHDPLCAGVWTWSRGGGWGGPHSTNGLWCDLNALVVARWAQNPARSEPDIFNEVAADVSGIRDPENLARLREIALLSAAATLRSQNSLVHKLDVWWNRDDTFADITGDLRQVRAARQTEAFLAEKAESVAQWRRIEKLGDELVFPDAKLDDFVRVSCTYGRIKAEIIEQMCRVILGGLAADTEAALDPAVVAALARYDALWAEWHRLRAEHSDSCPTLYRDQAFSFASGVPGLRPGMGAAVNRHRPARKPRSAPGQDADVGPWERVE